MSLPDLPVSGGTPETPGIWLSVVTPVRNGAAFMERCLHSVASQADQGVEHIIVDGGSSDGTVGILERHAERHASMRWVSVPGSSQSAAMNRGLAMARGSVIGFLNVDDYYETGTLARVREVFAGTDAPALVIGNCRAVNETGEVLWINRPRRLSLTDLLVHDPQNPDFPINPSAYFCHRTLFDIVGGYDADDHYTMDLDFILRAVPVADVVRVDEIWGNFVLHDRSKTVRDDPRGAGARRFDMLVRMHRSRLAWTDRVIVVWKSAFRLPRRAVTAVRDVERRAWRSLMHAFEWRGR